MTSTDAFLMPVEDVFHVEGLGDVCTGRISEGSVAVGDVVEAIGSGGTPARVTRIERFRVPVERATAGENVGVFLEGDVGRPARGNVIASPGSMVLRSDFVAEVSLRVDRLALGAGPLAPVHRMTLGFEDSRGPVACSVEDAVGLSPTATESRAVSLAVQRDVPLREGSRFTIVGPGALRGDGVVTSLRPADAARRP